MTQQLIAIDSDALNELLCEVRAIRSRLDAVEMQPRPEWLTVADYAAHVGKTASTVTRWIDAGLVESRHEGKTRMVRLNPNA